MEPPQGKRKVRPLFQETGHRDPVLTATDLFPDIGEHHSSKKRGRDAISLGNMKLPVK